MLMLFAEPVAPPDAQRPGCGCVGSFGRQIRCRGLSPAAVCELWRSPEPAAAPPMSRASSDPTAGETTTSSYRSSPYPCDPCDPWFISGSFLDHGLHGFHGWARHRGCGSGRANQTVEATATRSPGSMPRPGDASEVCGRRASPCRSAYERSRDCKGPGRAPQRHEERGDSQLRVLCVSSCLRG